MSFTGQIILENGPRFLTGGTIKGWAEIYCKANEFVQEISINFEGITQVSFQELDKKLKHGLIVYFMQNFESKDHLVQQNIRLAHNDNLPKTINEFKFNFFIPQYLPSTLTTNTGMVKYEMVLHLNDSRENYTLWRKVIFIQKYDNICQNPKLELPVTERCTKKYYWWTCKAKPISIAATLASRAFIPGDNIKYLLQLDNQTNHFDVNRITTVLIQTIQYRSLIPKIKIKTEFKSLCFHSYLDPCPRRAKKSINSAFNLPLDTISSSEHNSLLMVRYRFQVLISIKGICSVGSLVIPVVIGSHRVPNEDIKSAAGDAIRNDKSNDVILNVENGFDMSDYCETIV